MRRHALAVAVLVFITSLADGSGLIAARKASTTRPGMGARIFPRGMRCETHSARRARKPMAG